MPLRVAALPGLDPRAAQEGAEREAKLRASLAAVAALTIAAAGPVACPLAAQPADTTHRSTSPLFTGRDAVILGAFAATTAAVVPADRYFAERLQDPRAQANRFLRGTAVVVTDVVAPGAFIIGGTLYGVGRLGGNARMADLGLHGTEAILVGLGTTSVLKMLTGRARPYVDGGTTRNGVRFNPRSFAFGRGFRGSQYRSFPSGHSVTAFAAAAAVTSETSRWWPRSTWYVGPLMYGGATLAGLSRMYDNKHWASDVVVGAAIGAFAGRKVVQYHHSHPNNRLDRWLLAGSVRSNGAGGVALRMLILPH